jgi:hypothetical protein
MKGNKMARKPMGYWAGSAHDLAQCYPNSDANSPNGYIRISRDNVVVYLHRWIWEQIFGPIPAGWEIDHINGVRTDNRLCNLRCIPGAANKRNMKTSSKNVSGVQGVSRWETTRRGNQKVSMWRATCNDQSGKQVIKTFSIKKYGEEQAFQMACEARVQMEKQYGYHPNHGR